MPDRFRDANLAPPGHASSASGPSGPESRHSPAPNLMFVPNAAPTQPDRGSRSVWRFGRYIAVY
jgi:hypothetical protein